MLFVDGLWLILIFEVNTVLLPHDKEPEAERLTASGGGAGVGI